MNKGLSIINVAQRLKGTPTKPGVYIMRDENGGVIYVGKAASLKSRISSYFQPAGNRDNKVQRMVSKIVDFEYVITNTITEALLLENTLIKRHKPFFNVRLKDDKTYPYIKIDPNEEYPQLYFTRRVLTDGARYFGPFASASSVRKTMDLLKRLFPYRSCTKAITGNDERACLEYYIHRCIAPCVGASSREDYQEVIKQVILFLEGNTEKVLQDLTVRMHQASEKLEYEQAAKLRDQVRSIESVSEAQNVVLAKGEEMDVIALASDKGEAWVELFNIRHGKLVGRDHFTIESNVEDSGPKMLEAFIQQFYDAASYIPRNILIQYPIENLSIIRDWLKKRRNGVLSILTPVRGNKRKILDMVSKNASEGLKQKRIKWLSESDKVLQAQSELFEVLSLPELPNRIECYDISNIQGTNSVGSMVVFEGGKPNPSLYRRFQIKNITGINDYSSMQEMLRRRFKRLGSRAVASDNGIQSDLSTVENTDEIRPIEHTKMMLNVSNIKHRKDRRVNAALRARKSLTSSSPKNSGVSWEMVPNLVIIDGGKGHLSAAQQVFLELGITDIPIASVAKQYEEIYLPHVPEPIILPRQSQGLYLIQRIRDEAHRFAITYHRLRRSRAATRSVLDSVTGIGPKRRRMLLAAFGSIEGIRQASIHELMTLSGFTERLVHEIKDQIGEES